MIEILTAGAQVSVACLVIYFALSFFRQKQKVQKREDIQNMEAKMSALRMMLKAKVKKKGGFFRATFGQPIKTADPVDQVLTALTDLPFEKGDEFQNYFELSKKLNNYMSISEEKSKIAAIAAQAMGTAAPAPTVVDAPTNQPKVDPAGFMTNDIKNEFAILKIMNEMVLLSHRISERCETFNESNTKNPITIPQPLKFAAIADIKRVFSDNPDMEKSSSNVAA